MAYDDSNVEINAAGWGTSFEVSTTGIDATGETWLDRKYTVKCGPDGGSLSRVRGRLTGYLLLTEFKIKVFREVGADMVFIGEDSLPLTGYDGAGRFDFTLTNPIDVQDGDLVAAYVAGTFIRGTGIGVSSYYSVVGDQTATIATASLTSEAEVANPWNLDVFVETNGYVFLDESSVAATDTVELPVRTDGTTYIKLENVLVPDNDSFTATFKYGNRDGSPGEKTACTILVDFVTNDEITITDDAANSFALSLDDNLSGTQAGDYFDIFLRTTKATPTASTSIDVMLYNKSSGQYKETVDQIWMTKHESVSGDNDINATLSNDEYIKRVVFSTTSAATIEAVRSVRNPILPVADSYVQELDTTTTPDRIKLSDLGEALKTSFSEQRDIINGGILGSEFYNTDKHRLNLLERYLNDFIYWKDVVFVFVNGSSINDPKNKVTDEATQSLKVGQATGSIELVSNSAIALEWDVVIAEMIDVEDFDGTPLTSFQEGYISDINTQVRRISSTYSIPYAATNAGYSSNGGYDSTGYHPDTAGDTWIADQIANGYENNLIATTSGGGGGYRSGRRYS